jgi:hypothetical protein
MSCQYSDSAHIPRSTVRSTRVGSLSERWTIPVHVRAVDRAGAFGKPLVVPSISRRGNVTQQMRSKTDIVLWLLALLYLLGYAAAVYYRIAIGDWLVAHVPL